MSDRFSGGEMMLPVFVGADQNPPLAKAKIEVDDKAGEVTITIKSTGQDGLYLAQYLMSGADVALSFIAIPVEPRT